MRTGYLRKRLGRKSTLKVIGPGARFLDGEGLDFNQEFVPHCVQ